MIRVRIVTPEGVYRELETSILNIRTVDGQRGILPSHMPLVTMLDIGVMSTIEDGKRQHYAVAGGMVHFESDKATILTAAIEHEDDIDLERAKAALERAKRRLDDKQKPGTDYKRAELALKRALNRVNLRG